MKLEYSKTRDLLDYLLCLYYPKVTFRMNLEHKVIAEALTLNLSPKTYRQYVDDIHARFTSKEQSREFQNFLNKQDKHIQFTTEDENEEKCLNFLDIKIKNNNGRYESDVHCKPALTNVQIKPHSCIPPDTITSIFKGFLVRAPKICSDKYLREEKEYLTDIFCENGHDRKTLQKIIALKRKHVVAIIIIIITLTKSKQLPLLGNQKSDQQSNNKYKSLALE